MVCNCILGTTKVGLRLRHLFLIDVSFINSFDVMYCYGRWISTLFVYHYLLKLDLIRVGFMEDIKLLYFS